MAGGHSCPGASGAILALKLTLGLAVLALVVHLLTQ
jgi:hypothetical protein